MKVYYIRNHRYKGPLTCEDTSTHSGQLSVFIKAFNCISAAGYAAHPVFLMACDEMEENEFLKFKVEGLTSFQDPNGYTFICLTKSRSGNDAFHSWYQDEVMIPFAKACVKSVGGNRNAVISFDGEEIFLRNLSRPSLLEVCDENNIDLFKHSASCSALCNALDSGNIHKTSKTYNENLSEWEALQGEEHHQKVLDSWFKENGKKIISISSMLGTIFYYDTYKLLKN